MSVKPAAWTVEKSETLYSDQFVTHRVDRCITERGKILDPYHVMHYNDWCNVIALTASGQILVVEEYRHGVGRVVRGFPGGTVEPGEDPALAMPRELEEETGYLAETWLRLPTVFSNASTNSNSTSNFIALDAAPTGQLNFDDGETIAVFTLDPAQAIRDIFSGKWQINGLHSQALFMAREYARQHCKDEPRLRSLAQDL